MQQTQPQITDNSPKNNSEKNSQARFPLSIVSVSREELIEPVSLTIRDADGNQATLPEDLHGLFFLTGPAGSVNSPRAEGEQNVALPSQDGWTALYNGDGMVHQIKFTQGHASLRARLLKPPCYYADRATSKPANSSIYQNLAFQNAGISRASFFKLGVRNQLNTAFVPFKLKDDESTRLLVTWDVGRPYEIDPETLEILTPVGNNQEWSDLLANQPVLPFKNILTSAHPVFDFNTEQLFTLNIGKSIWTLLDFSRSLEARIQENSLRLKSILEETRDKIDLELNLLRIYSLILGILKILFNFLGVIERFSRIFSGRYDFVHLLMWDAKEINIKKKWNIILPNNRNLKIAQTAHQMGLTEDYIIFIESSFKFTLEKSLPFQKDSLINSFKIFLANFIDYPQYPYTKLYIIKRADLNSDKAKVNHWRNWFSLRPFKNLPNIVAREIKISPEFCHYQVDFKNKQNQIVLHIAHLSATDIAECIRNFDCSGFDSSNNQNSELNYRLKKLAGSVVNPLDINRLGRWVIDGETGKVIDKQLVPEEQERELVNDQIAADKLDSKFQLTWRTAFYAFQDQQPTERFTDIFWNSWGASPDTLTAKTLRAYQNYPNRLVDLERVTELAHKGIPSSICHLRVINNSENDTEEIEINPHNYFQFAKNNLGTSAQFIPRPNAKDQTDGYIVCVVLTSDEFLAQSDRPDNDPEWSQNSEIWIFDAQKLNQGPLYKMSHPKLNIGFSFHTTWMPEAKSPKRRLEYDVKEDYEYLVEQLIENQPELGDKIRKLFDEEIYPNFK